MGYCASANGTVTVKDTADLATVREALDRVFDEVSGPHATCPANLVVSTHSDSNYHDSAYFGLYERIAPFVADANVEFAGDDDSHWKHVFSDGQWREIPGKVVYNESKSWAITNKIMEEDLEEER